MFKSILAACTALIFTTIAFSVTQSRTVFGEQTKRTYLKKTANSYPSIITNVQYAMFVQSFHQ